MTLGAQVVRDAAPAARAAALRALATVPMARADSVAYHSRGGVLVLGEAGRALPAAESLAQALKVVAVVTGLRQDYEPPRNMLVAPGRIVRVSGHLGRFRAAAEGPEGELDLSALSPNPDGWFDLVVDLGSPPLIRHEVPPLGYFAAGMDDGRLALILREAPSWVGRRDKPKYLALDTKRCAHRRQGVTGCTRCIEACPAGALAPGDRAASFDPYLCQGCGSCAGVCPTGAIAYSAQSATEVRRRIRVVVEAFVEAGGSEPCLLLHDEAVPENSVEARLQPSTLPVAVHSVASIGVDVWLYALTLGVKRVELLPSPESPSKRLAVLRAQQRLAHLLLGGVGARPKRISLSAEPSGEDALDPQSDTSYGEPSKVTAVAAEGLTGLVHCLEHLRRQGRPVHHDEITLPEAAPVGGVKLDASRCSLCMACARLCPTEALCGSEGGTSLQFREEACVQCGLCQAGCPEQAIRLAPRWLTAVGARSAPVSLIKTEAAVCSECGTPFLPRTLLDAATARVQGNSLLAGRLGELLTMCPVCRAKTALAAQLPGGTEPDTRAAEQRDGVATRFEVGENKWPRVPGA
jgi:ferredoxin